MTTDQYLVKTRSKYGVNVAVNAEDKVNALRILLDMFALDKADIMYEPQLSSGSYSVYKVYLNDDKQTVLEFIVVGCA